MRFQRVFFIVAAGFLLPLPGPFIFSVLAREAPSQLRLTLEDCLDLAAQNNVKLPARDYAIDAAAQRYDESKAHFWPILEYSNRMAPVPRDASNAAGSFFEGDVTFLNATRVLLGFPVYTFGQLDVAQEMAQTGLRAAQKERVRDESNIHFEVRQLYYGILFSHDMQGLMKDAVAKINNQLKKEEETRSHSPYEILKLKVFKADLEKRVLESKDREREARMALRLQMGLSEGNSFDLAESHLEPAGGNLKSLEHYVTTAEAERPDSQLVTLGVELKKLEYDFEKKKLLPKLGFGSFFEVARTTNSIRNLRSTDDFNNPFNYVRAGAGIELKGQIDFHGSSARLRRLESEYQKTLLEKNLAKEGMRLEVQIAYHDARRLQETMRLADEKQKMARQMMFLSKANLDIGVGEEKDYTEALQLVLLTRGEYLKSVFDYNMSVAKLDQKIGRRYVVSSQ